MLGKAPEVCARQKGLHFPLYAIQWHPLAPILKNIYYEDMFFLWWPSVKKQKQNKIKKNKKQNTADNSFL